MKKPFLAIPLLFASAAVAVASHLAVANASTAAPAVKAVAIADYSFKPMTITVDAGTSVVWTNKDDDPHTVTADDGAFDSKGLGQGDTYARTFSKPGRFPYHCSAHPFMKGVVVVTKGG